MTDKNEDRYGDPIVFLGGETKTDWREDIIDEYSDALTLIDPVDEDWEPEENIYEELADMLLSDEVVFFKGGEGTEHEKDFLDALDEPYEEFDNMDEMKERLDDFIESDEPLPEDAEVQESDTQTIQSTLKTAQHDYDPSWDYEIDENPSEEVKKIVDKATAEIRELVSDFNAFSDFSVHFITDAPEDNIAVYANGTQSAPVVMIDVPNTEETLKEYPDVSMFDAMKSSILHELGHALQEYHGLEMDEDQAEMFAEYHMDLVSGEDTLSELGLEKEAVKTIQSTLKTADINLPIEVGDEILTGRFKNKRVEVKKIGVDDKGQPTVNGRPILNIRVPKLMSDKDIVKDGVKIAAFETSKRNVPEKDDVFHYGPIADDMWSDKWEEAKDNFKIRFDWENNDSTKERKVITITDSEDDDLPSKWQFNCDLWSAGGDWEYSSYYFKCQLQDGSLHAMEAYEGEDAPELPFPGAISEFRENAYFILIPPVDGGNAHLIAPEKEDGDWTAPDHSEYSDDEVPERDSKAAWEWLEEYLTSMVEKYTAGLPKWKDASKKFAARVVVADYKHGCVYSPVPDELRRIILKEIAPSIPENDLFAQDETMNGIETDTHITVLFGIDGPSPDTLKTIQENFTEPITIKSSDKIEYFDNEESVAIIPIESEQLTKLHDKLKEALPNKETYPEYKPHITIAYLQPGTRLKTDKVEPFEWEITKLVVTNPKGKGEDVYIDGHEPVKEAVEVIGSVLKEAFDEGGYAYAPPGGVFDDVRDKFFQNLGDNFDYYDDEYYRGMYNTSPLMKKRLDDMMNVGPNEIDQATHVDETIEEKSDDAQGYGTVPASDELPGKAYDDYITKTIESAKEVLCLTT